MWIQDRRFDRRGVLGVFLLASLGMAAVILAQAVDAPRRDPDPSSIYGRDNNQSVYVADSAIVVEKTALAERMERLQEWSKAAEIYQEIIDKHAARVLPSQIDSENRIYQYSSVAPAIQARLSRWPEAGRQVYLARYEPLAAELLREAMPAKIPQLHRVLSRYFVTESARDAGIQLVGLYLESGDFSAAAWLARRLLAEHPLLDPSQRAMLQFRLALAWHLAGETDAARKQAEQLRREHPGVRGMIAGREVALDEELPRLLEQARPAMSTLPSDSWPTVFGSIDRSRVPPDGARSMVRTATIELRPTLPRNVLSDAGREYRRQKTALGQRGHLHGILPVVDNGEVFFHDNARVYAVSLATGLPLPGWSSTYGGDAAGTFAIDAISMPLSLPMAVELTDNEVLAILGQPDLLANQMGLGNQEANPQLVSLDRRTGRKLWSVVLRTLHVPEAMSRVRELQMVGTPLVVGDNVYVLARGGRGRQFEESQLLCLRRGDGAFVWASYLASSSANSPMWGGEDLGGRSNAVAQLAYASGRVFVLTNLGGLAAVDAFDGSIAWLNIYPRTAARTDPNLGVRRGFRPGGSAKPFTFNPVMVSNGRVFILPADGEHVLIYDAGTGVEVNRLRLSHFGNAHTLLGIVGSTVLLANDQVVFAVDWTKYDSKRYDPARFDESLRWKSATIARPNTQISDAIRGRAFVTEKAVYVPTAWDLRRFSLAGGRLESTYPAEGSWDEEETSGNVLVLPEHLLIAGSERISIYTDPTILRSKLDAEEKARPTDPEPRIRSAEVLFVSGDRPESLRKLDEAIALMGGLESLKPGPDRERLFAATVTFARKLLADPEVARSQKPRLDLSRKYLVRAAAAAQNPSQQVEQRLLRARLAELTDDPATQVKLYQELLDDPELRAVTGVAGAANAAGLAELSIDRVIKRVGRSIYAEIEARAVAALDAAIESADVEAVASVADRFPNSTASTRALLEAARMHESAERWLQAATPLRRALSRELDELQRARVYESMARNYLKLPKRRDMAVAQLRQAARLAGGEMLAAPLPMPDGRVLEGITIAKALQSLEASAASSIEQSLPDFNLTVVTSENRDRVRHSGPFGPPASFHVVERVEALASPISGAERYDRLVVWANDALRVLDAATLDVVCEVPDFKGTPLGSAWQDDTLIVWNNRSVFCIDAASGTVRWKTSLSELGGLDLLADDLTTIDAAVEDEDDSDAARRRLVLRQDLAAGAVVPGGGRNIVVDEIVHVRLTSDRVVIGSNLGRWVSLQLSNGAVAWQNRLGASAASHMQSTDDFTVAFHRDNLQATLVVLDSLTGRLVYRRASRQGDGDSVSNFALGLDGTLVFTTRQRLVGKDLHDPSTKPMFQTDRSASEGAIFANTVAPGQLVIADGRILVLTSAGTPQQAVRVFSLADGKPLKYVDPKSKKEFQPRFNPETGNIAMPPTLHVIGSRLYLVAPRSLVCYNLDTGAKEWARPVSNRRGAWSMRDVLFGRDYVVAIDEVGNNGAKLQLNCFNRTRLPDGPESGTYDYAPELETAGGFVISQWQPIQGGLVVRTKQNKLLVLRGQRNNS